MRTNYYLRKGICGHCNKPDEELHIGKSSGGWCFSLHVIPESGINTLDDWKREFATENSKIIDEFGTETSVDQMLSIITERHWSNPNTDPLFYRQNHAVPGPNGLARHALGDHCVAHGEGTYDYIPGEFS